MNRPGRVAQTIFDSMAKSKTSGPVLTADAFMAALEPLATDEQREKYKRYFKSAPGDYGEGDVFTGVPMGQVFAIAKRSLDMPPDQIELLMESEIHEHRAGAMSTMDKQARVAKASDERRRDLHDLYLRRIDRVNNWDLVDLAAGHAVGRYLFHFGLPIDELRELAGSEDLWARRTAIVATSYFLTKADTGPTFEIAELLVDDDHDLIQKAVGGWVRHAGKRNPDGLHRFLDRHAATMPPTMLTHAVEKLDSDEKARYRAMRNV